MVRAVVCSKNSNMKGFILEGNCWNERRPMATRKDLSAHRCASHSGCNVSRTLDMGTQTKRNKPHLWLCRALSSLFWWRGPDTETREASNILISSWESAGNISCNSSNNSTKSSEVIWDDWSWTHFWRERLNENIVGGGDRWGEERESEMCWEEVGGWRRDAETEKWKLARERANGIRR